MIVKIDVRTYVPTYMPERERKGEKREGQNLQYREQREDRLYLCIIVEKIKEEKFVSLNK